MFRTLIKLGTLKKIKNDNKIINENLRFLKGQFKSPIDKMIVDFYLSEKKTSLIYILKFYIYDDFLKRSSGIKAVLAHSENTSSGKIIIDAARNNTVKGIGIQHGAISKKNIAYNFSKKEHAYFCIPDKTLIWGENTKDTLIKYGNYKEENLLITGQIRSDSIQYFKNTKKENTSTACYFSQPQPNQIERKLAAEEIIKAAKKNKDIKLIIKLHPNETEEFYQKIIKKHNAKNVVIANNDKSLYQILALVNLAITCYSTVGMEAILFELPILIFDSQSADKSEYLKNDIGYHCKNENDINYYFDELKKGKLKPKKSNQIYAQQNFYKIDGKASERTIDFLRKLNP